jgi:phage terminase large subunit-like protein
VHAAYQTVLSAWHFLYCLLLHKSEFETASLHQQLFKDMSPPTKELMKLTLEEKLAHGGHPVLRWMMDNIYIRTDPAGNIKAEKEKSTEKIDGAIATIMGLDRAIRCGNDSGASVYDNRGILFI